MPDKPAAEVVINESLVRALVDSQAVVAIPDADALPLSFAATGWDCSVWRLGEHLAVRLPRRSIAVALIRHEQQALPAIAARVESAGVRVPVPVFAGAPGSGFPWPWSIVPWIEGDSGLVVPRADRTGWAVRLATALVALHAPAPDDAPANPFRGVPLAERSSTVTERLASLADDPSVPRQTLHDLWTDGVDAAPWRAAPVWVHGDLHPGNLVARGPELAGIIDFGDVTSGDPAYDLAVAWLAFDEAGRSAFVAATAGHYDQATWTRAKAWAVAVTLMLVLHSDDNPAYAALGRDALAELTPPR